MTKVGHEEDGCLGPVTGSLDLKSIVCLALVLVEIRTCYLQEWLICEHLDDLRESCHSLINCVFCFAVWFS